MKYRQILHQRNFVWMTVGTSLSTFGDQIGWIAVLWLVMSMTRSPAHMGFSGLCYGLPSVVVGAFAGVLMDRYPRVRLMVLDNVVQGVLFLSIPVLQQIHLLPFWMLCAILVCAGVFSPLTLIGAMTLVPDFVPGDMLSAANAWDETL